MIRTDQLNRRSSRDRDALLDDNFDRVTIQENIDLEEGQERKEILDREKETFPCLTPSSSQQDLLFRNPYRNQFKRLSEVVRSRTELHSIDPTTPDPPTALVEEEELSGLAYWFREASTAKQHGGDYKKRHDSALRAALGGFAVFSVLVFPHQQGTAFIGR